MNQVTPLALVDSADAKWSIVAQCRLLKVARSSLYWRPAAASEDDLRLMRRIDELYLMTPFNGARRMVAVLRRDGWTVNRKAGATAAAPDADRGDLPAAEHQPPSSGPCCLPLSFAWSRESIGRTRCGAPTLVCRGKRRERWGTAPRNRLAGADCKPP